MKTSNTLCAALLLALAYVTAPFWNDKAKKSTGWKAPMLKLEPRKNPYKPK